MSRTIVFVIPPDHGHFDYTINVALELYRRGYLIEYFSCGAARSYAPDFAKFNETVPASDDTFVRFTRAFSNMASQGDSVEEANAYIAQHWMAEVEKEFGGLPGQCHLQGTDENLIRLKSRILEKDVALCIYDASHMYRWVGTHCKENGVPSIALAPQGYFLHHPEEELVILSDTPPKVEGEPEYSAVRKDTKAVPHLFLYPVLKALVAGCKVPDGREVIGPIVPKKKNGVPEKQEEAFKSSPLKEWCDSSDDPIVYLR